MSVDAVESATAGNRASYSMPYLGLLWLRSLLFFVGFWAIIGVFTVITCLFAFLPSKRLQDVATLGNAFILVWLRLTCNLAIKLEGMEAIPPAPVVFLSNHQSTCETFCLQRVLRPVSTVIKKSLLYIPFFGWMLYLMHPIAIDRGSPKQAIKQVLQRGTKRLQEGYNVVIYPEGTRLPDGYGKPAPFARSGAALALKASVPVVPVAHNAGRYWPNQFIKYPGTIRVVFGPAIAGANDSKQLTNQVQGWVEQQLEGM